MIDLDVVSPQGESQPNSQKTGLVRGLAIALVVALFVGPVIGYRLGHNDNGPAAVRAKTDAGVTAPDATTTAASAAAASTTLVTPMAQAKVASAGMPAVEGPYQQNLLLLFAETRGEIGLRVYTSTSGLYPCSQGAWCPPARCTSQLMVEVSNATVAATVGLADVGLDPKESALVRFEGLQIVGAAEGSPFLVANVAAGPTVDLVRVSFGDLGQSLGAVHDGRAVVVMALPSGKFATDPNAEFQAFQQIQISMTPVVSGVDGTKVTIPGSQMWGAPSSACIQPPPTPPKLPEPTGSAPADAVAAKAAVIDAFTKAFHGGDQAAARALVEDGDVLAAVMDAASKTFADAVKTSRAEVNDFVFVDDHTAAVIFTVSYELSPGSGTSQIGPNLGYARLINGTWVVARESFCQVLSIAAPCPPK